MISSNVSSILSHQTFMNNSAHNIANANTDGFIPQNTTIHENGSNSTKAIASKAADTGAKTSQTNLTKEITDQIMIENVTKADVVAIRTQDEMLGSLLDIKA
jgi:flagellar hook protein FlgE